MTRLCRNCRAASCWEGVGVCDDASEDYLTKTVPALTGIRVGRDASVDLRLALMEQCAAYDVEFEDQAEQQP